MRKTLPVLVVLLLAAVAVFAADVNGTWKGTVGGPDGGAGTDITVKLKAEGNVLTGTVSAMGSDTKIDNGKIDGDNISFETNPEFGKIVHTGTVSGDEIKLKVKIGDNEIPMVLKRVK
jgi:hypothetical protein